MTRESTKPELPTDEPGLIALWQMRLDPARFSILEFVSLFKVPTKRPGLVLGRTMTAMTKFDPYEFQREVIELAKTQWDAGEGMKFLGGKPRQEGLTTIMLLLAFERFCRAGGGLWNYFSYDDPHSIEAFSLLLKLKRQVHPWVFTHLVGRLGKKPAKDGEEAFWTKKSHRQLELSFPGDGGSCALQCATAGGEHSGSGSAPRGIFLDEFTKYPDAVKLDHTGISEGWADAPGNVFAYWGTGQGKDSYSETFTEAWVAGPRPNHFVAMFRPWLGHKDRWTAFRTEEEKSEFVKTVGTLPLYGIAEEKALSNKGATPEELHWRRNKLATPAFRFNLRLFSRENPMTPDDMFVSDSGTIFQVEILHTHDAAASRREAVAKIGDFVERPAEGDIVFIENRAGSWTLYEERRDDLYVCYGADSAGGSATLKGTTVEADFADAHFDEVYSGRTVARFRAHLEGSAFGVQLMLAARYYRSKTRAGDEFFARGFPEVNNESGAAMMMGAERYCEEHGYGLDEFVLCQRHAVESNGTSPEPTFGWRTTGGVSSGGAAAGSRGVLIDEGKAFIAKTGFYDETKGTPFTEQFLTEAYSFERIYAKDGRRSSIRARTGHDDAVLSKLLALVAREELLRSGVLPSKSDVVAQDLDPVSAWYANLEARQKEARKQKSPLGAGY